MAKTTIIAGQSASLSKQIMEKYSLTMIPFVIEWKTDKNNPEPKSIFQKMSDAEASGIKNFPKTAHPAPWLFKNFFEEKLKNSDSVFFISLSSKLSPAFKASLTGKEMLPQSIQEKIFIFDSRNVSAGEGLIAIKASEKISQGKTAKEVFEFLQSFSQKVCSVASVKDVKWLKRGKRVGALTLFVLNILQKSGISLLLGVKNGQVKPIHCGLKQKSQALEIFKFLEKKCKKGRIRAAIAHSQNEQDAEELKNLLQKNLLNVEIIFIGPIDNIIGTHTGPGALICAWHPLD